MRPSFLIQVGAGPQSACIKTEPWWDLVQTRMSFILVETAMFDSFSMVVAAVLIFFGWFLIAAGTSIHDENIVEDCYSYNRVELAGVYYECQLKEIVPETKE